ncbi:hypothetical protein E2C01_081439 [Portunus trituberculatus]|uniref:Uncharacterized protein n=1 Tax=Portunus trituberculatus TaxID=210409 RepID=A0A5B7IVV5_PORTR|nr:hypothetical protein [Portunus trituberculatus]
MRMGEWWTSRMKQGIGEETERWNEGVDKIEERDNRED